MPPPPYPPPRQYAPATFPSMTAADPALPVVVVGAGPVGMGVALGLAHRGIPVTVLEAATGVSFGSAPSASPRPTLGGAAGRGFAGGPPRRGLPWGAAPGFYPPGGGWA